MKLYGQEVDLEKVEEWVRAALEKNIRQIAKERSKSHNSSHQLEINKFVLDLARGITPSRYAARGKAQTPRDRLIGELILAGYRAHEAYKLSRDFDAALAKLAARQPGSALENLKFLREKYK